MFWSYFGHVWRYKIKFHKLIWARKYLKRLRKKKKKILSPFPQIGSSDPLGLLRSFLSSSRLSIFHLIILNIFFRGCI
ncbi:hypothetical protein RhiirC2_63533 [Rhizophagus irregularis]|uniref:Uncharacterized protein n=1 Tax=Rhizophagus irregularis TaxID=588596 RepID=A0A2N1MVB5_9GLOM|nr:hypothetical protein RhiirC2_63533 [Rhizophagus irregularis]